MQTQKSYENIPDIRMLPDMLWGNPPCLAERVKGSFAEPKPQPSTCDIDEEMRSALGR